MNATCFTKAMPCCFPSHVKEGISPLKRLLLPRPQTNCSVHGEPHDCKYCEFSSAYVPGPFKLVIDLFQTTSDWHL